MSSTTSTSSFIFRRATAADAVALTTFAATAFTDTFAVDNTPEDMTAYVTQAFGERQQREELSDPATIVLLAERESAIAGYAMVHDDATPAGPARVELSNAIEIARLYAGKRWIGTGLGAMLMQRCLDVAAERGRTWIWLGVWERNARAIAFYARWGFADVGSQSFQLGADRQTDRIMARHVAAGE
jgi:GNAT superfamily N-acetyltransferase